MEQTQLNWIANFIWGIADDVLRDLYVRGKYRDVILPMTVLRRLDAVLEPSKQDVLDMKRLLDESKIVQQDQGLRQASGQAFYNTSQFTLRDLKNRASKQQLKADFEDYLDGFSPNVQEILNNFEFRNQIPRLSKADALGTLIEKLLDPEINLSPKPTATLPGLDNHAMGTIFEELVRRFNEENNEEAGEHWTPRDAVKLMARLIFLPIAEQIDSGTYLLYDGACGTGGMLTVAEETLQELATSRGKQVATHLYGQEINAETYAICKADLLIKGEGDAADNIIGGPEYSTLANDAFPAREFDFMLSNPPYGKSWKSDLERMGGKKDLSDPRFMTEHDGNPEFSLITRSSDGQMLFLANMISKMKHNTELGSRIATVHNGSSLFTGDAGQGESNIRQWIIENDWLEAIIALPLNMFYNTGIATYIWVLSNRKPEHRQGKVQLIDASDWYKPLRKNLGKKNCELSEADIQHICETFLNFEETEKSKIFDNKAFGYKKVRVERPLRLKVQLSLKAINSLQFASGDEELRSDLYDQFGEALSNDFPSIQKKLRETLEALNDDEENTAITDKQMKSLLKADTWARDAQLLDIATALHAKIGDEIFDDYNIFIDRFNDTLKELEIKLKASDKKAILNAISWRDENAAAVIKKTHKASKKQADPLHGLFPMDIEGVAHVIEYESDSDLRDYEQIPLLEEGGIQAFIEREVLPYVADAWVDDSATKTGYEISFTRYFYKPQELRPLTDIRADIIALERETEGLLEQILNLTGGTK